MSMIGGRHPLWYSNKLEHRDVNLPSSCITVFSLLTKRKSGCKVFILYLQCLISIVLIAVILTVDPDAVFSPVYIDIGLQYNAFNLCFRISHSLSINKVMYEFRCGVVKMRIKSPGLVQKWVLT